MDSLRRPLVSVVKDRRNLRNSPMKHRRRARRYIPTDRMYAAVNARYHFKAPDAQVNDRAAAVKDAHPVKLVAHVPRPLASVIVIFLTSRACPTFIGRLP